MNNLIKIVKKLSKAGNVILTGSLAFKLKGIDFKREINDLDLYIHYTEIDKFIEYLEWQDIQVRYFEHNCPHISFDYEDVNVDIFKFDSNLAFEIKDGIKISDLSYCLMYKIFRSIKDEKHKEDIQCLIDNYNYFNIKSLIDFVSHYHYSKYQTIDLYRKFSEDLSRDSYARNKEDFDNPPF